MTVDAVTGVRPECQILEFDSDFFGCRIARIEPSAFLKDDRSAVDRWCRDHRIDCAYLLAEPESRETIAAAEANGFGLVDLRVQLTCGSQAIGTATSARGAAAGIRLAQGSDLEALRAIARTSHRDTRFYADGRFDRSRCDALYDLWITRSCSGWADAVFVADRDGIAAGYLTCVLASPEEGHIGLVGVEASSRGRGYGRALIDAAVEWFRGAGRRKIVVVTQGRNTPALRVYQQSGFAVESIRLWYHKWF